MSFFRKASFTRRDVLKQSGILTAASAASALSPSLARAEEVPLPPLHVDPMKINGENLFTEIGVRPLINARGTGEQQLKLKQEGDRITGTQKGVVHADQVELRSDMAVSGNDIPWTFEGVLSGSDMSGTVQMGEYGTATWSAVRA